MRSIIFASSLTLFSAFAAYAEPKVGFDRFVVQAAHRAGPIAAGIWSPIGRATYVGQVGGNAVFEHVEAYIGAALPNEKMPLIVVSHGSGSSIDGTAWLAAGLAERGALVLVLNHPGTTTGDSSPRQTVRLSERAEDLSAALDHVLNDPYFSKHIDTNRITALGFSLGGSTVLGLAGLRLDSDAYRNYCDKFGESAQDCLFLMRGGVDFDNLPFEFSADMADARFTSFVAVDPGFTYAAIPESAAAIQNPVQLVTLGDSFPWFATDLRAEGSGLVGMLPNTEHAVIPNAFHYSFLPICTENAAQLLIEEGEDPICDNPDGWDRLTAHNASIQAIAQFLKL
ncbi:alpha/beta fold hydrolase [Ahrensia sp. 13_GOM-1096m]|uniref:alpha/beta hydrolase family protein n=1 Tax=Ahrensia sp. 13_GOM-1096m TaxID=1380380 RepID=UPI00047D465A|nr:alpha/beta fold hydrolase [Ahrensia sp. 13_GOM-1096m]